jgi:polar amino acid transport system substrate-binding protein
MDTATAAAPVTAQAKPGAVIHRIQQRGELLVGTAGDMPPLNMTTRDGKVIGYDADLGRYISKAMGVQLKLKTMPFSELLSALESGKVDMVISGMTITPKRNLKAAFVGPYLSSGKCFLTKLDSLASAEDTDEIDVSNMTLTALKGSTSENFVKALLAKAKYLPADNYDEGVKMVLDGKVDAMVADYPICATSIIRYPEADLASLFTLLTYEPLGIALPPNDPLLVNWMQNLLNGLDGSGILKELKAKWFEDASWVKELP